MRLQGKVAIVTGASRGIGLATAKLFAAEGALVYGTDICLSSDVEENDEAKGITWLQHDITQEQSWREVVAQVLQAEGRIDVLFNNAGGVGSYEPIHSIALADWHRIIDLNLNGAFYGIRHVVPAMQAQHSGSIINVSSIWGIAGAAGVAAYTASKGAVRLMSKNAALSYVQDGIRVNSVHPGIIATPMIDAQDDGVTAGVVEATPMKRLGRPEEIAYGVLFLASDESSYMTGAELVIDGGYTTP
ncbi:SDR family NAD(P)-dependent oxidoreductase [Kineococcus sp. SYSU DK003]|uniref:SDR family NAD(P)-dependent oxidoreductase n=1 Tax=Kineococcus sp. SYSU DK003 TaxID=3383124 RepID=UPI003D7F08D3